MDTLKTYNLFIGDEIDGVSKISLVENPAIEINFLAFSSADKKVKYKLSEDKQIITTPILVANKAIYRNQLPLGEHYVVFPPTTIEQIVQKYFKDGNGMDFNIDHSEDIKGMYIFESYIVNRERGINPPNEFSDLPDGSWMGSFKIDNPAIWQSIKDGRFKGVSVECFMAYTTSNLEQSEEDINFMEYLKEIYDELKKLK